LAGGWLASIADGAAEIRAGTAWPGRPQVDSRNSGARSAWTSAQASSGCSLEAR
jgi:hypothetical protein